MPPAIKVENLSKSYLVGHNSSQGEKYTALRDVVSRNVKNLARKTRDMLTGRQIVQGDEVEEFWALKDISFEIQPGDRVGIIGRNGAGKSTLLKILSRITEPTRGRVTIHGRVASLLEVGTGFHPELTGRENIFLNGAILGMSRKEIQRKFDEIVDFAEVEKFLDTPVKRYSSGMYVRLAFAVAAHLQPEILIVDEVLAVGDAQFQKKCLGKMREASKIGLTILFVSHNLVAVQNLCRRVIWLQNGHIFLDGRSMEVSDAYTKSTAEKLCSSTGNLRSRIDRSGNGKIKITDFWMEDGSSERISFVRTGQNVIFAFGYKCQEGLNINEVDIGFSLDNELQECVFCLYSSYANKLFSGLFGEGVIRCAVNKFSVSPGIYVLGARILVMGEESDWPNHGVGSIEVIAGDYYGTGSLGFGGRSHMMVDGNWTNALS